jgi:hypothetical protein
MSAMSLRFPPHQGQVKASISKTRSRSSAHVALFLAWSGRSARSASAWDVSRRLERGSAGTIQSRHSAAGARTPW